jgi:hypothetical protein
MMVGGNCFSSGGRENSDRLYGSSRYYGGHGYGGCRYGGSGQDGSKNCGS